MKRGFILLLVVIMALVTAISVEPSYAGADTYYNQIIMRIENSAYDDVTDLNYTMLPSILIDDLRDQYGYVEKDIKSIVRIKPSDFTVAASLVIDGANIINENAGYFADYATDGLDAVINSLAEAVISTTVQTSGGTPGKYAVYAYTLSEDFEEALVLLDEVSEVSDLASAQTIGLTLATKLLNTEMNYINSHMSGGFSGLAQLDIGEAQDFILFAVFIDKFNAQSGLMEKGVKYFYLKKENGIYSYPNYYSAMVYSTVNIYPEDNIFTNTYNNALWAVQYAEAYPTRSNILAAYALVHNAPSISRYDAITVRINTLMDTLKRMDTTSDGQRVVFADADLEYAVRQAVGKPQGELIVNDVKNLRELYAPSSGISDIGGLEFCMNLEKLDLSRNAISSLEPIRNLKELTDLTIHNNAVSDLGPLNGKSKLTKLVLWNNNISDVTPLSKLYALKHLDLSRNNIRDIMPIRDLTNLEVLSIAYNNITSIEAVRYMTKLYHFYIGGNSIYDVSPTHSYYHNIINKDF